MSWQGGKSRLLISCVDEKDFVPSQRDQYQICLLFQSRAIEYAYEKRLVIGQRVVGESGFAGKDPRLLKSNVREEACCQLGR